MTGSMLDIVSALTDNYNQTSALIKDLEAQIAKLTVGNGKLEEQSGKYIAQNAEMKAQLEAVRMVIRRRPGPSESNSQASSKSSGDVIGDDEALNGAHGFDQGTNGDGIQAEGTSKLFKVLQIYEGENEVLQGHLANLRFRMSTVESMYLPENSSRAEALPSDHLDPVISQVVPETSLDLEARANVAMLPDLIMAKAKENAELQIAIAKLEDEIQAVHRSIREDDFITGPPASGPKSGIGEEQSEPPITPSVWGPDMQHTFVAPAANDVYGGGQSTPAMMPPATTDASMYSNLDYPGSAFDVQSAPVGFYLQGQGQGIRNQYRLQGDYPAQNVYWRHLI